MIETNLPVINDRCHTTCSDCIFAVYDEDTQVGCNFNDRVEKYKEKSCLIEAEDNEKKFFIINNRFCLAKRTHHWKNKVDKVLSTTRTDNELEVYDNETYTTLVRTELEISYDYVIYVGSSLDTDNIEKTLINVVSQPILPKNIVIINNVNLAYGEICKSLAMKIVSSQSKWQIRNICEDADRARAIHTTVRTLTNKLFALVTAGYILPTGFIQDLDKQINDEILDFCAIRPDKDGNCLISNPLVYKNIGGDKAGSFLSKLEDIPKTYPILNMEDICQH